MKIHDLFERVILNHPGSNRVIDFRSEKRDNNDTHITLTKDHSAIIWNYADGNKLPWSNHNIKDKSEISLYDYVTKNVDKTVQADAMTIRFTNDGILLPRSRLTGGWLGNRNRYSNDLKPTIERLLDLNIITPRTPIYVGNWARRNNDDAERIGTASQIINAPKTPNTITLYHGTSNVRAKIILEEGFKPMDRASRAWKPSKTAPDHRDESVYLTASMDQAEYYAKKMTNVDKARLTYRFRRDQEQKLARIKTSLDWRKKYDSDSVETTQRKINQLEKSNDLLDKMNRLVDKVEPAILKITLTRADYAKLLADDDYIVSQKRMYDKDVIPNDWRESLSHFGQVAFRGTISPDKISVL